MNENDNIQYLYDNLKKNNYLTEGSVDDFRAYLEDDNNRASLYDNLKKKNFLAEGSLDDFNAWLGVAPAPRVDVSDVEQAQKPSFEEWYKTVPADRNDTTSYNLRRAYELAPMEELEAWRTSSVEDLEAGKNHLRSAYENPETGEYEFVKRKDHPTIQMELDEYEKDEDFKKRYRLDKSGDYYKYIPRDKENPTMTMDEIEKGMSKEVKGLEQPIGKTYEVPEKLSQAGYDAVLKDRETFRKEYDALVKEYNKGLQKASGYQRLGFSREYNREKEEKLSQIAELKEYIDKTLKYEYEYLRSPEGQAYLKAYEDYCDQVEAMIKEAGGDNYTALGRLAGALANTQMNDIKAKTPEEIEQEEKMATEGNQLIKAKRDLNNARRQLRMTRERLEGDYGGFRRGWRATDVEGLSSINDFADNMTQLGLAKKVREGKELSNADKVLLAANQLKAEVDWEYASSNTTWERVGMETAAQGVTTIEFLVGSGLTGSMEIAGGVSKNLMKNMGTKAAKDAVIGQTRNLLRTGAAQGVGMMAGAGVQTFANPLSYLNMMSDYAEKRTGTIYYDDKDKQIHYFDNEKSIALSLWQAAAGAYVENLTEFSGEGLDKLGKLGMSKIFKAVPELEAAVGTISGFLDKVKFSQITGLNAPAMDEYLRHAGFNGTLGEYGEEVLGNIIRPFMYLETEKGDSYGKQLGRGMKNLIDEDQNLETFLSCAVTGVFLGATATARSTALQGMSNAENRRQIRDNIAKLDAMMDDVRNLNKEDFKQYVASHNISEISQYIKEQAKANDWSEDELGMVAMYVSNVAAQQAYANQGSEEIKESVDALAEQAKQLVNKWDGEHIYNVSFKDPKTGEYLKGTIVNGRVHYTENEDGTYKFNPYTSSGMLAIRIDGTDKIMQVSGRQVLSLDNVATIDEQLEAQGQTVKGMMEEQFRKEGMMPTVESAWGFEFEPNGTVLFDRYEYMGKDAEGNYSFLDNKARNNESAIVKMTEEEVISMGLRQGITLMQNQMQNEETVEALRQQLQDMEADADLMDELDELKKYARGVRSEGFTKAMWKLMQESTGQFVTIDENGLYDEDKTTPNDAAVDLFARCEGNSEKAHNIILKTIVALMQQANQMENAVQDYAGVKKEGRKLPYPEAEGDMTDVQSDSPSALANVEAINMQAGNQDRAAKQIAFLEQMDNVLAQMNNRVEELKEEDARIKQEKIADMPVSQMEVGQEFPVMYDGQQAVAVVVGKDADGRNVLTIRDQEGNDLESGIDDWTDEQWESMRVQPVNETYGTDGTDSQEPPMESAGNGTEQVQPEPQPQPEPTPTPNAPTPAPVQPEPAPEQNAMPMRKVKRQVKVDGQKKNVEAEEEDYLAVPAERTYQYLYEELASQGLTEQDANDIVNNNLNEANKTLDEAKKKTPSATGSAAARIAEKQQIEDAIKAAQGVVDYWNSVKAMHDRFVAERLAAQQAADEERHAQAVAEEEARRAEEERKAREREATGANNVAPNIREKWEGAQRVEGNADEITLANGERIAGHYVLVESGAASASHDALNGFAKTEGFPLDENEQSVNDRDYERDQNAQQITRQIAAEYDSRALQQPVVVSQDGVVLSGNGRTMAGEIAAAQNTDGAYIDYLKKYAPKYGFTPEQVEGMAHPRVVFVPDASMPYTAETFAKFNQQEMKGQSKTEQAVKLGKLVDDATFGRIIRSINRFDTLGDFYADTKATADAIGELLKAGAINQMQHTEMFDGDAISAQGREILENMLIGKAFESNPDAVRQLAAYKSLRQSVITALAEISNNIALGEYSLESELSDAIALAYNARKNGYKAGDAVSEFARQGKLFETEEDATAADYTNATVLMLADVMNDNRVTRLKKVLSIYNQQAEQSAAGQTDLFAEGVKTKQEILDEVLVLLQHGTESEQQQALDAAVEQRKAAAEQGTGVQENGDTGEGDNGDGGRVDTEAPAEETGLGDNGISSLRNEGEAPQVEETTEPETPTEEAPAEPPMESAGEGTELTPPGPLSEGELGPTDEAVAAANEEVDTNPTEAQKEAGNYKKGHVTIDGFDISIENPAGSTRSGTDAQGNPWSVTMHNSYGYIRMTEGVDGDHIDIFLSDHIDDWNGTVYVVDQVNEDGSFDEHKVMYGFNSAEEAREAYLSNYSEGWQGLGTITGVSREEFKKWVDSSHRKTKAFADYKSVQTTEGQNEAAAQVSEENNGTDGTNRTDNQAEGTAVEENSGNQGETSQDGTAAEQPIDDSDIDALIEDYKKKAAATNKIWSAWLADPSGKPADYGTTRDEEAKAYGRVREALAGVSEEKLAEMENTNYGDSLLNDLIKEERNRRNEQKEIEQRFVDGLEKQGEIGKPTKPVSIEKILPEFTSRDEQRPIMNCIYYDTEGYAVASDAYILMASKSQYDPKQEGKMVAAHKIKGTAEKGDEVEGKFMKWRNVISQAKANSAEIDLPKLRDFLAGVKELMKGSKDDAIVQVRMPNGEIIGFEPEYLLKFVQGAEAIGVKEIEYIAPNRAITGRSEDGIVLLMPKKISADYGGREFYYDLSDSSESLNDEKPTELFSIDEPKKKKTRKSLIGLHNISADKLRKVLKKGGLANPSTAVIDIDKQDFTGYGEISLVMPSSLVDSRTGNNAGTYLGDAWTPTYPSVETMLSSEGDKKVEKIASENSDGNEEVKNHIKSRLNDFAEKNGERLWYLFLKQTGRDPVLSMKRTNTSEESYEKLKDLIDGGIIHKNELTKEESDRIAEVIIDERFRKKDTEGMTPEALDFLIKSFNEKNLDEDGILYFGVWNRFIESLIQDERTRKNPKIDFYDTEVEAQRRVYDEGLTGEYEQWKQSLFDDADIDERLFAGFTPSGTRRYMANTTENASKIMNKLADTNSYDNNGLSATRASLLKKVKTLSDIRKNKELLKNGDEFKDEQERLSDELFSIIEQVSSMQKISDNPFINNDYAEARLQEAFTKRDPIKHLNDEYGYDIEKDSDLAKQINGFVEEVKSLPVKYFETKFRRPVQLNEFVAAVVPQDLPQDLKDGLQQSGLTLYEYDPKDENSRREATLKATEDENIRFSVNNGTDEANGTDAQQVAYNAVREALANAGIEVVEATEEDVKRLKDSRKQLKDSKGTIRGWVGNDGKIHLTKDGLNAETPIHEYTHLWAEALQMNNPDLWEQIKGLLKDTPEWQRITSMKEYSNLKDDDRIAGEVLAHISGKKNAERMEAEAKRMIDEAPTLEEAAKAANLLGRMRDALKKFWTWVGKTLLGKKGNINIDQVSNMVLADLTNGVDPFHPRGGKRTNRTKRTDASIESEQNGPNDIERVNQKFNDELQQQMEGTLPSGHVYDMGMPSAYLRSTGIPNLPIRLQSSILNKKSDDPLHPYKLEEVKDLVKLIQKPLAIFAYGDKTKAQNLMIGISQPTAEGKQFLVGLALNPDVKGKTLEINSVRNVFPKNYHDWIHWIIQGKMLRVDDRESIKAIIDALRINPVDYISDNDLDSAANIVENFENPQVEGENFSDVDLSIVGPDNQIAEEYNRTTGYNSDDVSGYVRGKEELLRSFFDGLRPLEQMQQLVEKDLGRKLRDSENAYGLATLLPSLNKAMMDKAETEFMLPVLRQSAKMVKAAMKSQHKGLNEAREMLNNYLLAKHGLERNEWFFEGAKADYEVRMRKLYGKYLLEREEKEQASENRLREKYAKYLKENEDTDFLLYEEWLEEHKSARELKKLPYEEWLDKHQHTLYKSYSRRIKKQNEENKKKAKEDEEIKEIEPMSFEDYKKTITPQFKDKSGLTGLAESLGENPDDYKAVAEQVVADFEDEFDGSEIDAYWASMKALTDRMLEISFESGMINKDTFESLKARYKYYVPLRGFADGTSGDLFDYVSRHPHFQSVFKKMKGRKSKADDPLANLYNMLQSAIVIGNQNKVMQNIYNLAVNAKSDLLRVNRSWYVYNDATDEWEERFPDILEDATADEIDAIMKQFDADMQQLKQQGKAKQQLNKMELQKKVLPYQAKEHEMTAYINGRKVVMHVAGNPLVAQQLNKANTQQLGAFAEIIQGATRFASMINTSLSPAFMFTNAARDIGFSLYSATVTGGLKKNLQMVGNLFRAGWVLPRLILTGKMGGGITKMFSPTEAAKIEQWWNEFLDNGGETGFTNTLSAEKAKGQVDDMIRRMINYRSKDGQLRLKKATLGVIETMGRYSEDISRFAAYCLKRAEGETVKASVNEAKNVTVNFNVKGGGNSMVARFVAGCRSCYSFFNAALQGINRMGRLAKENPKAFAACLLACVVQGAMLPWLNMALFAMLGGDDDDWEKYEMLSEYTANHNLIIFVGNHKFLKIPYSQELAPFAAMGNIWFRQQMGWNHGRSIASQIGNMFLDLAPVNIGESKTTMGKLAKTATPTILMPVTEWMLNENFTAAPIEKRYEWNKFDSGWEKAYESRTSKWLIDATRYLDEKTNGSIDINPSFVEHIATGMLGGIGRSGDNLMKYFSDGFQTQNAPYLRTIMFDSKQQGYIGAVSREYGRLAYEVLPEVKHDVDRADMLEFARLANTQDYQIANVVSIYKTGKDLLGNKTSFQGIDKLEKEFKKAEKAAMESPDNRTEQVDEYLEAMRAQINEMKMEMLDAIDEVIYNNSGAGRKGRIDRVREIREESKAKAEKE